MLAGSAPISLLDSYHEERAFAADDNLLNSTRSTDFITPKSEVSRSLRDAVLGLAATEPFARRLVNSGRLSTPTPYRYSSLNTADEEAYAGLMTPGTNCADAPVNANAQDTWLLGQLGDGFTLLCFGDAPTGPLKLAGEALTVLRVGHELQDRIGVLTERYDARPGTVYLIRPDQHVAARWRRFDADKIRAAVKRCLQPA